MIYDLGQQEEERFKFLKAWALQHDANEYIVFDITSFSSYAKNLDFLEWGYNRDREKLPQINFGLIYGEPSSLPFFYTRYPGSIKDVSTLHNMVEYLEWLELSDTLFVLDRGFFSSYNLKHDIERKRLRIHTQETFEGRLFLDFLVLIIYSKISSVMRKEGINKDFTVQELMYEFKKIKLIRLGAKKMIVTEVSKKQRELFQSFKIPLPTRP